MIVMVFLVAAAILTASVVYDVKNRREMAAELEDWSEVKSRRIIKKEKLFLAKDVEFWHILHQTSSFLPSHWAVPTQHCTGNAKTALDWKYQFF